MVMQTFGRAQEMDVPRVGKRMKTHHSEFVLGGPLVLLTALCVVVLVIFLRWGRRIAETDYKATESEQRGYNNFGTTAESKFGAGEWKFGSAEEQACNQPLPESDTSSEEAMDPEKQPACPGERVRMEPFEGMEYQLFLPKTWKANGTDTFPVVVFFHGAGDGKFSVMNSQSLPRLLARDQSTVFDSRHCWCLDLNFARVQAQRESSPESLEPYLDEVDDLRSPLADCDFVGRFGGIVVMPQGWLPDGDDSGWSRDKLEVVTSLTRAIIREYRGDPSRVTLTGQSAGGAGAWHYAAWQPKLWAAVNVICMPASPDIAESLEGVNLWVVGWALDGILGNDAVVRALKKRKRGTVRYTRYVAAPAPPDPKYRSMLNHASYDLIYRDPRFWDWAFSWRNEDARALWISKA